MASFLRTSLLLLPVAGGLGFLLLHPEYVEKLRTGGAPPALAPATQSEPVGSAAPVAAAIPDPTLKPDPAAITAVDPAGKDPFAPRWHATPPEQALAREAFARVAAWYADGGVKNDRKLHVVYFMPKDAKPLPGHRDRFDRILKYISAYYAKEMRANGLPPLTFKLDTDADGIVKLHEVYGDKPLSGYSKYTNAGKETREAAERVLRADGIDPAKNHMLIVCQMPDGVAPYYGDGSGKTGLSACWVCDLPGLDIDNLTSRLDKAGTLKLAADEEGRKAFRGRALGPHTAVYTGGIAHELGHCFNLPHTGEDEGQHEAFGVSLMGQGTFSFGDELRGAGKGTFLVPTDALILISQSIFFGMDKQVDVRGKARFAELQATPGGKSARISGKIASANVPVYAVVVTFNLGTKGGDYHSNAVGALVDPGTGEFSASIARGYEGPVDIMLTALHMNGQRTVIHAATTARGGILETGTLNKAWLAAGIGAAPAPDKTAAK